MKLQREIDDIPKIYIIFLIFSAEKIFFLILVYANKIFFSIDSQLTGSGHVLTFWLRFLYKKKYVR